MRITSEQLRRIIREEVEGLAQAAKKKKAPAKKAPPVDNDPWDMPGPSEEVEDFVNEFSMKNNSAAEMWLDDGEKEELFNLAQAGAKFKVIVWDRDDRRENAMAKARQAKFLSAGYTVFAGEAGEAGEVIMVKE